MEYQIKEENGKVKIAFIQNNVELAKATCYFENTPEIDGKKIGTIGEFSSESKEQGIAILHKCEEVLKEKGVEFIVSPMNGNTWKQYRTLKYTNGEPFFLLEKVNPIEDNDILKGAGFKEIYTYTSTKGFISDCYESENFEILEQNLIHEKINIRKLDRQNYVEDLKKIYHISVKSFCRNPMYTSIGEKEFLEQYIEYIEMVDEEFILIAEQEGKEVGFVFCIPDFNEMKTLILKTIAVLPEYEEYAIGNIMLRKIAQKAKEKDFEKWIFAFMYSNNTSQKMAKRNKTEMIREYALYGKEV